MNYEELYLFGFSSTFQPFPTIFVFVIPFHQNKLQSQEENIFNKMSLLVAVF